MKKTIGPCLSEPSGKHMEHEQVKEVLARNGSAPLFSAFGVPIPKGDALAIEYIQDAAVHFLDKAQGNSSPNC